MDVLRIVLRWGHAVAAVAWIGGSLFFLLVLNPALAAVRSSEDRRSLAESVGRSFRDMVRASIAILTLTGALLLVDVVSRPGTSAPLAIALALHATIPVVMFLLTQELRRGRPRAAPPKSPPVWWLRPSSVVLLLGLTVYVTAVVIQVLVEHNPYPGP